MKGERREKTNFLQLKQAPIISQSSSFALVAVWPLNERFSTSEAALLGHAVRHLWLFNHSLPFCIRVGSKQERRTLTVDVFAAARLRRDGGGRAAAAAAGGGGDGHGGFEVENSTPPYSSL